MSKKTFIEGIAFIVATGIFIYSCLYILDNLDKTPITIRSFAVLEYVFFYGYTIYDHIKNIE